MQNLTKSFPACLTPKLLHNKTHVMASVCTSSHAHLSHNGYGGWVSNTKQYFLHTFSATPIIILPYCHFLLNFYLQLWCNVPYRDSPFKQQPHQLSSSLFIYSIPFNTKQFPSMYNLNPINSPCHWSGQIISVCLSGPLSLSLTPSPYSNFQWFPDVQLLQNN